MPVFVVTPDGLPEGSDQPVFLDIHGGAFFVGFGDTCRVMAKHMAHQVQMRTWSVDYRTPPDHPYPAALNDCMTVYRRLLDDHPADRVVVGGGSAGGNLACALVLRARDEGLALPGALVLLTPEADLTESGDTYATNLGIDSVLTASLAGSIALYADGHDLTDPYLSPLFGDFSAPFPQRCCSPAHTRPVPLQHGAPAPQASGRGHRRRAARLRSDAARRLLRCARGCRPCRRDPSVPR